MFDLNGNDRLVWWREFRNNLETTQTPFEEVINLWNSAPFVSDFLNYNDTKHWPDPWHLIIDGKYDQLALCLGMLYTIKLTQRFNNSYCEIHMSISGQKEEPLFFLIIDNRFVLNYDYGKLIEIDTPNSLGSNKIWAGRHLP